MKKHLAKTMTLLLTILLLSGNSLTVFAFSSAENNEIISSHGEYVKQFDESKFKGMAISYTEAGDPIVDDPNATHENTLSVMRTVTAITEKDTWLYQTSRLNTTLFMIPKGKVVTVMQTNSKWGSAQISYAGAKGWVYSSHLRLG